MLINIDKIKALQKKMEAGMSEFSDKLSEYIAKSGSNVYQLAKEASLDRTTLQKTAKYPVNRKRNWFVSIRLKSWDTVQ